MAKKETIQIRIEEDIKSVIKCMAENAEMNMSEFLIAGALNLTAVIGAYDQVPYKKVQVYVDGNSYTFDHDEMQAWCALFNQIPKRVIYNEKDKEINIAL